MEKWKIPNAYPSNEKNDDGSHHHSHGGMSLRDYFAAAALQGILSSTGSEATSDFKSSVENDAKNSYVFADAMLKARSQS